MAGFPNPVHSILRGILTGYSVANQIRRAALEEEEARRRAEIDDVTLRLKDLEARSRLFQIGRPVIAGTVTEEPPEGSVVPVVRPARKGTLKYKSPYGESIEVEPYSPEELERRRLSFEKRLEEEKAKSRLAGQLEARERVLARFGVQIGDSLTEITGLPPSTRVLPSELDSIASAASRIADLSRRSKEDEKDPVVNFYPSVNDAGDVTVISVHRSGKISSNKIKGAGKTSDARLSPTERRLQDQRIEEEMVERIAGEILSEVDFDIERALKHLPKYFIDNPDKAKYRARVYMMLSSRASRPDQFGAAASELMQRLYSQSGQRTTAPVSPQSTLSREAREYLKKHGLE